MTIVLERRGSALEFTCTPRGPARRGGLPTLGVANWRCLGDGCASTAVIGSGLRDDGPGARAAKATCAVCGKEAGTIRITGLPRGALPVSA